MNINTNYPSIEQMTQTLYNSDVAQKDNKVNSTSNGMNFADIFKIKQGLTENVDLLMKQNLSNSVSFSKHASERLESRNIELSTEQLQRLNDGTRLAREKGIKDSLIMVDDYSFIVNIKNNTVVTALNEGEKNVFTNIDGAVIA